MAELAEMLGVSRIAVFKKIRSGKIKAEKIGRNYVIPKEEVESIFGLFISEDRRREIEDVVKKTISEYGKTLRLLGKE